MLLPFKNIFHTFHMSTLEKRYCWQKLNFWAQSPWTDVCYQCTQTRCVGEVSDIHVHSTLTQQSTASAQNGLEGQMDMPHLRTEEYIFQPNCNLFTEVLFPFLSCGSYTWVFTVVQTPEDSRFSAIQKVTSIFFSF